MRTQINFEIFLKELLCLEVRSRIIK